MLTRLKDILLDPLWWKLAAVFAGYFFAVVNLLVDPADIATLPDDASPYHASRVKAGGFALITAIALFVALISRGTDKRDKLIEGMAQLLGVLAACGAGWYVLDSETQGNPGLYIVGIVTLTGLTVVALAIAGGFWVVYLAVLNALVAALKAATLLLSTITRFLVGRLRRKQVTDD